MESLDHLSSSRPHFWFKRGRNVSDFVANSMYKDHHQHKLFGFHNKSMAIIDVVIVHIPKIHLTQRHLALLLGKII